MTWVASSKGQEAMLEPEGRGGSLQAEVGFFSLFPGYHWCTESGHHCFASPQIPDHESSSPRNKFSEIVNPNKGSFL